MFGISPHSHLSASCPRGGEKALVQRPVCMGRWRWSQTSGLCLPCYGVKNGWPALQLWQPPSCGPVGAGSVLWRWAWWGSACCAPTAAQALASGHCGRPWWRAGVGMPALVWAAVAAFALCGLRASGFCRQAWPAAMGGAGRAHTAVVAAMPQRTEAGVRLRLQVCRVGGLPPMPWPRLRPERPALHPRCPA